jgi:hypothetical protein
LEALLSDAETLPTVLLLLDAREAKVIAGAADAR